MDFTREPIIETIITPKEGCKLVVRSTKNTGQEEYLVDAVEVVSFGQAFFFRSLERPKAFLAPASDFEVLEVREARMVLKNVGVDRSIKIGGGREGFAKPPSRDAEKMNGTSIEEIKDPGLEGESVQSTLEKGSEGGQPEVRVDKKRDRRRHYRKRRGREEQESTIKEETHEGSTSSSLVEEAPELSAELVEKHEEAEIVKTSPLPSSVLSSLLQPPPTLISETIGRYRQNELFKSAFFLSEEDQYKPHDKVQDLLEEEELHKADTLEVYEGNDSHEAKEEAFQISSEQSFSYSEEISPLESMREHLEVENSEKSFGGQTDESVEDHNDEMETALPLYAEEEGLDDDDEPDHPPPFVKEYIDEGDKSNPLEPFQHEQEKNN